MNWEQDNGGEVEGQNEIIKPAIYMYVNLYRYQKDGEMFVAWEKSGGSSKQCRSKKKWKIKMLIKKEIGNGNSS